MDIKYDKKTSGIEKPFTQLFLLGVLFILIIFLSIYSPFFLKWNNIRNILDHAALQLIMAIGMTFVISTRGIDLSVGSTVALTGIFIGLLLKAGFPIFLSSILGVLAGGILGTLNGILISKLKIAPYVVTIGTMSLYRGLSLVITKGQPIYGFPVEFTYFGKGDFGRINPPIILAFSIILLGAFLLRYTKWGQYALALGGNEEALRRVGVSVNFYKTTIYTFRSNCRTSRINTSRLM